MSHGNGLCASGMRFVLLCAYSGDDKEIQDEWHKLKYSEREALNTRGWLIHSQAGIGLTRKAWAWADHVFATPEPHIRETWVVNRSPE